MLKGASTQEFTVIGNAIYHSLLWLQCSATQFPEIETLLWLCLSGWFVCWNVVKTQIFTAKNMEWFFSLRPWSVKLIIMFSSSSDKSVKEYVCVFVCMRVCVCLKVSLNPECWTTSKSTTKLYCKNIPANILQSTGFCSSHFQWWRLWHCVRDWGFQSNLSSFMVGENKWNALLHL